LCHKWEVVFDGIFLLREREREGEREREKEREKKVSGRVRKSE